MKPSLIIWMTGILSLAHPLTGRAAAEDFPGFTQPYQEVRVAAAESGVIDTLQVHEGDEVQAGQVLGHLDLSVLEAALRVAELEMNAKGALHAAEANFKLKQARLQTLRELHTTRFATSEELSLAETEMEESTAEVLRQEENLAIKRAEYQRILAMIELRKIKTPISGVIAKEHLFAGEYVSAINPTIFTVVQLDQLVVNFSLPVEVARKVKLGQDVTISFANSRGTVGTVDRIAPVIDGKSLTVKVRVVVNNQNRQFQSGEKCSLVLNTP